MLFMAVLPGRDVKVTYCMIVDCSVPSETEAGTLRPDFMPQMIVSDF